MTLSVITPINGHEILPNSVPPPVGIVARALSSAQTGPGLLVLSHARQCLFSNAEALRLMRELRRLESPRRRRASIPSAVLRCCRDLEGMLQRHPSPRSWRRVQLIRVLGGEEALVLTRFHAIPTGHDPARISLIVGLLEPLSVPLPGKEEPAGPAFDFSEREQACVAHLVQGMTDKEIASHMGISEYTVKDHLKHIRQKTGAINRAGIITRVLGRLRLRRNGTAP